MATHRLKVWSQYFDALAIGEKPFEVRRDDRGYQKGDILVLRKCVPGGDSEKPCTMFDSLVETGEELTREITYVLAGGQFGIDRGFVVLGLRPWS